MNEHQSMPPGWYPDPSRPGWQREWDGHEWIGNQVKIGAKGGFPIWLIPVLACIGLSVVAVVIGAIVGPEEDEPQRASTEQATTTEATTTTARVPPTTEATTTTERPTTTTTEATTTTAETTTTTTEPPTTTTTRPDAGPNGEYVLAEDFGDEWPLTVGGGALRCEGSSSVTFEDAGTTYAINGTARGDAASQGWADIFESAIWADNPSIPGTKKDIGVLIDAGLDLC